MRSMTVVVLAVLALAMPARSQDVESFGIYSAEFGGALLGGALGAAAVGATTYGIVALTTPDHASRSPDLAWGWGIGIGAGVGYPLGSAAGTALVGHWLKQQGRFWPTAAGAGIGMLAGGTLAAMGAVGAFAMGLGMLFGEEYSPADEAFVWVLVGIGVLGPPIGAVIAYNRDVCGGDEWSRRPLLVTPEFALVGPRDRRGLSTGVGIRLAI